MDRSEKESREYYFISKYNCIYSFNYISYYRSLHFYKFTISNIYNLYWINFIINKLDFRFTIKELQ